MVAATALISAVIAGMILGVVYLDLLEMKRKHAVTAMQLTEARQRIKRLEVELFAQAVRAEQFKENCSVSKHLKVTYHGVTIEDEPPK